MGTVHPTPLYPILALEDARLTVPLFLVNLELFFKEMQGIAKSELRGWPRYRAGHVSLH